MKKKLEAELISIAHRILQLKDSATLPQLQEEARQLYEKLTILSFSESHFAGPQPTIGQVRAALDEDTSEEIKMKERIAAIVAAKPTPIVEEKPEATVEEQVEPPVIEQEKAVETPTIENKHELVIEEINARVTEDLFVPATTTTQESSSFSEAASPVFERADNEDYDEKPKSLNDQLRKEIHIGLNDRLAFIKYLFDGSAPDYNRVLSQLSTLRSKNEAEEFIATMVKPDYNHWDGKEEYEERFTAIVLSKFEY